MLSGDNSILQRATDAKTRTDETQIRERIQLAYHSALAGGQGSYTKNSLMQELKNEFKSDYDVDDSDDTNWILSAKGQSVTIPAGEKEKVLAKDKLVIDEDEGASDSEKSPYVKYNGGLYRVLYDSAYDEENGTDYGVQIVLVNPSETVTLGKDDPIILENNEYEGNPGEIGTEERAKWSYNNAIITLNKKAQTYLTDLADEVRCIGSDPSNPLKESDLYVGNEVPKSYTGDLKGSDTNSNSDLDQLRKIGGTYVKGTSTTLGYWFASRMTPKRYRLSLFCFDTCYVVSPCWNFFDFFYLLL